jgi:hypothetical protein
LNIDGLLRPWLWPCFFIFCLRKSLADLIKRSTKISRQGIEAEKPQDLQAEGTISLRERLEGSGDEGPFVNMFSADALRAQEQLVLNELENQNINEEQDLVSTLVTWCSAATLFAYFETAYRVILSSQLLLLRALNPLSQGGDYGVVNRYYSMAQDRYGLDDNVYPMENFLRFLFDFKLITESNERYFMTDNGREFLQFIIATGKPELTTR